MCAGQQKSERGERKQEREEQRPTVSRKERSAQGPRAPAWGSNPPTGSRASQPTSLSTECRVIGLASGVGEGYLAGLCGVFGFACGSGNWTLGMAARETVFWYAALGDWGT